MIHVCSVFQVRVIFVSPSLLFISGSDVYYLLRLQLHVCLPEIMCGDVCVPVM